MARRQTFQSLVEGVRNETGRSTSVSVGVDDVPRIKHEINKAYQQVWDMYAWPHLKHITDKMTLSDGERFYDFPSTLSYDDIESVRLWRDNINMPVCRGITIEEYNSYDSTDSQESSQVLKWDIRATGSTKAEQFEVWPVPNDNEQKLQFIGRLKFEKLVADADLCYVDDWLVILIAASKLVKDANDKQQILAQAKDRFETLTMNAQTATEDVRMGLGPSERDPFKGVVIRVT